MNKETMIPVSNDDYLHDKLYLVQTAESFDVAMYRCVTPHETGAFTFAPAFAWVNQLGNIVDVVAWCELPERYVKIDQPDFYIASIFDYIASVFDYKIESSKLVNIFVDHDQGVYIHTEEHGVIFRNRPEMWDTLVSTVEFYRDLGVCEGVYICPIQLIATPILRGVLPQ